MSVKPEFDWSQESTDEGLAAIVADPTVEPASVAEDTPKAVAPLVVVHYRMRWTSVIFMAISTLLMLGSTILTYSRFRLPWEPEARATRGGETSKPLPTEESTPTYVRSERFDSESGSPAEPNLRAIVHGYLSAEAGFALNFNLPNVGPIAHIGAAGQAVMDPEPAAPKTKKARLIDADRIDPAEVWNDIEREANDRQVAEDLNQQFKEDRPAQARREAINQFAELKRQSDQGRQAFRQALRGVVDRSGLKSGQEVRRLVEVMHDDVPNEVLAKAKYLKENSAARLGRSEQLDLFRSIGLPETSLLYHLVELEKSKVFIRGGPRSLDEAWARAAKVLLDSPPGPKSQAAAPLAKLYFTPNAPHRDAARAAR